LTRITSSYAFRQPRSYVEQMQQRLDDILRHLVNQTKAMFESSRRDFKEAAVKFDALNPLSILKRGYSVTYDNSGNLVLKANELKMGDTIKTRVFRGVIYSKVLEARNENE
jgi:exodeoxyribonuclease VII large subunit